MSVYEPSIVVRTIGPGRALVLRDIPICEGLEARLPHDALTTNSIHQFWRAIQELQAGEDA